MLIRYFVLNTQTRVMHIVGLCQQTKSRSYPVRLFDSQQELEEYAGRKLCLCQHCAKELEKRK